MIVAASVAGSAMAFDDMVQTVNNANTTWTAESPTRFGDIQQVKALCGTWLEGHPNYVENNLPRHPSDVTPLAASAIPTDFDARAEWPKCTTIATVRDQSACGSCWAFGSTEAFSDSRCIATGEDILYSTEDTTGCCSSFGCGFSQGCNGGQPSSALQWMTSTGVVTGGDYADLTSKAGGCQPYSLAPCAHHVPATSKYPECPSAEYSVQCQTKCTDDASGKTYSSDKTMGKAAHSFTSVAGMQSAIMSTGPLAVAFTVYADFPTYKSGVYTHVSGSALGGHAVEMVGWGVEDGTDYWWIKNSWNDSWGNGGFFKIARGTDECGIENDVTGITF